MYSLFCHILSNDVYIWEIDRSNIGTFRNFVFDSATTIQKLCRRIQKLRFRNTEHIAFFKQIFFSQTKLNTVFLFAKNIHFVNFWEHIRWQVLNSIRFFGRTHDRITWSSELSNPNPWGFMMIPFDYCAFFSKKTGGVATKPPTFYSFSVGFKFQKTFLSIWAMKKALVG